MRSYLIRHEPRKEVLATQLLSSERRMVQQTAGLGDVNS